LVETTDAMRALLLASLTACASVASYADPTATTQRPSEVTTCDVQACGGSGDAVTLGVGLVVVVGIAIAKFWRSP
jgi:hypothetical protein